MTVWSSLNAGEIGTLQDLRDSCDVGYFTAKQSFSGSPKAIQKDEVNAYVNFTAFAGYNAKSLNQLIAKEDIGAVGGSPTPGPTSPPPPTPTAALPTLYYLVQQTNCSDNGTTTTATLGAQVSAPIVGQFVTLSNTGGGYPGCWRVTSIGTGYGATTIIANYGNDCTCAVAPTTPVIVLGGTLSGPTVCAGVASIAQTFTVSGTNLVANVVVTPPSGYEVSTYDGGYASSVSLSPSVGTLSTTTIYVRLKNNANNGDGGLINVTSTNAVTQTINTGTAVVNALPTVTSTTGGSRTGTGTVTLSAAASSGATIDWYDFSNNLLASGTTSFTTPSISVTTTYYVRARNTTTGCISTGTSAVTATINADNNFKSLIIDITENDGDWDISQNVYRLSMYVPIPYIGMDDIIISTNSTDRHAPSSATTAPDSYMIAATTYSVGFGDLTYNRFGINLSKIHSLYNLSSYRFDIYGTRVGADITFFNGITLNKKINTLIDTAIINGIDFTATSDGNDQNISTSIDYIAQRNVERLMGYITWTPSTNTIDFTRI
jgi:hypothetical protein